MTQTTQFNPAIGDYPKSPTSWLPSLLVIVLVGAFFVLVFLGLIALLGGDSEITTRGTVGGLAN